MGRFRIQRLFAIVLGVIVISVSLFVPVSKTETLIGCFMVFWGFDGWTNE